MKRILCLALLFCLSGSLMAQTGFVNKVSVKGKGVKKLPLYKRLRQFTLDYYESVSEPHFNRYSSRLFLRFTPNRDADWPVFPLSRGGYGSNFIATIALRDKATGKEYYLSGGPGLPMNDGGIVLDNFGGEIRMQFNFAALPETTKSFDVLYNGQIWFSNVKIDSSKDDDINREEYRFGRVAVFKTCVGQANVYLNNRLAGWLSGTYYKKGDVPTCGNYETLTLAVSSDKIDQTVYIYGEEKETGKYWKMNAVVRPSTWSTCPLVSFD